MKSLTCVFLFFGVIFPFSGFAESEILLIGGGPTPSDSQVSIEKNTIWIRDILKRHYSEQNIHTLFTDGNDVGVDVHAWKPIESDEIEAVLPLARVYNQQRQSGYIYSSSHIANDVLPSSMDSLNNSLKNILATARQTDNILMIYQGHGGYNPKDTNRNYLRLWGDTTMTVTDLENLISSSNTQATVRFVFPQCFSGAFSRLIYKGAIEKNGMAEGMRCGFLAQREDRESEGCTDSVNTGDYRDYSTYFFSALDGKTIEGGSLLQNPDRNEDGKVTLREAHLYALTNAYSVDYSRSTSEDFLEDWQPWYLRWVPFPLNPDNVYSKVADEIALKYGIKEKGNSLLVEVKSRLKMLESSIQRIKYEREDLENNTKNIQKEIKNKLTMKWPYLDTPYTAVFRNTMVVNLEEINKYIVSDLRYKALVENQERAFGLAKELLDTERKLVQMKKIYRFRKLARTLHQLNRYANEEVIENYNNLVSCEDSIL